jgi:glycosyltransferase involved in cell wall biosynthesis
MKYLDVPARRCTLIYSGLSNAFRQPLQPQQLEEARRRYGLPPRFLLYCGAVYPPKNFTRLIRAYAKVGPARGVPLVIAGGSNRFLSESELLEPQRQGIADWVRWIGWLDNADYRLSIASRKLCCCRRCTSRSACPSWKRWRAAVRRSRRIATAHWNSRRGASVLVEPESIDDIAAASSACSKTSTLRATLRRRRGLARAKHFTWQRTAAKSWSARVAAALAGDALPRARATSLGNTHDSDGMRTRRR